MTGFIVGSPAPYQELCRIYRSMPSWDGYGYEHNPDGNGYWLVPRRCLEWLGIKELPVAGGRAVLQIELTVLPIGWTVNGDTIVKV